MSACRSVCSQEEEAYIKGHGKRVQEKLMYLIAKAMENGRVDTHLTPSFIQRWYETRFAEAVFTA